MFNKIRNFVVSLVAPKHRAQGIDGSHWWGVFRPEQAKKPVDFIVVKATQGNNMLDSAFKENYKASEQISVRGAYHYQKSGVSWVAQAEFFLRTVTLCDLHIYALDVEKAYNEGAFTDRAAGDTFFGDMRRILDYWRQHAPAKVLVVLYTNTDIYQNYIHPAIKRLYGAEGVMWLEELPLWLANYNGQGVDGGPTMPKNRTASWLFWQHSSNGKKEDYGTNGDADLNVYNGTVEEMRARILGLVTPGPTPEPPPVVVPPPMEQPATEKETWTGRVVAFDRMVVRSYPSRVASFDTRLRLIPGELVSGKLWQGNEYVWMQLDASNAPAFTGLWVAVRKIGGDGFIKLDQQPKPPTPPVEGELVTVVWDDQNSDFNFKSRTQQSDWSSADNPPAVNRYYPEMREKGGDFRVNLAKPDWKAAIIAVNGGDEQKWKYLTTPSTAQYNGTGWPMQAYLAMSGNKLRGEFVGDWFRFDTLKPGDVARARGMTIETHPHLVHRFTCVTFDRETRTTKRIESTGTPRGQVYYFLVTKEGYGFIPKRHVVKV